jgi:hypothetical protein
MFAAFVSGALFGAPSRSLSADAGAASWRLLAVVLRLSPGVTGDLAIGLPGR